MTTKSTGDPVIDARYDNTTIRSEEVRRFICTFLGD
jgi:hypothetical protein